MQKILIVDDEPHIRLLLYQTLEELEDEGIKVLTAANGKEALETIEREKPQLVFLDIMMPMMNGFEVCQQVKKNLQLPDIYIVFLTAKGQEFDKSRGREVGCDIYITKPFDPDFLLETARSILAGKAPAQPGGAPS
jgi:DNA-binding response OmpR family regulator